MRVPKKGGTPHEVLTTPTPPSALFVEGDTPFAIVGAEIWQVSPEKIVVVHAKAPIVSAARLSDGAWAWCTANAVFTDR